MVKRVVRKPVEKLSHNENVVIIESSSEEDESSSDEENFIPDVVTPKKNIVVPKPSTSNKIECDICHKEFSKGGFRMHRISCEKKNRSSVAPEPTPTPPSTPVNKPSSIIDDDDKPMTARQMKAFMESNTPVKKPRKPYTRKVLPLAQPAQSPQHPPTIKSQPPQIRWA